MSILWAINSLSSDNQNKNVWLSLPVEQAKDNISNKVLWVFNRNHINNALSIKSLYDATTKERWVKNVSSNKKIMLIEMVKYHDRDLIIKILTKQFWSRLDFISIKFIAWELWFSWDSEFSLFRELTIFSDKHWNIFSFFLPKLKQKLKN
jgi:predicted GIY-YIG superfamily endonuclease